MKILKNIWAQLHRFVFWALILTLLWSWIYTLVGDTTRAKKVLIYVDPYDVDELSLSERLEEAGLPEGIKMIQIRSFANQMFRTTVEGDAYLIKESLLLKALEETPDKLTPIQLPEGRTGYEWNGENWGILVFDAATQIGPAMEYIYYARINEREPENYYLCFDAKSPHLEDGALWEVVTNFLQMTDAD